MSDFEISGGDNRGNFIRIYTEAAEIVIEKEMFVFKKNELVSIDFYQEPFPNGKIYSQLKLNFKNGKSADFTSEKNEDARWFTDAYIGLRKEIFEK